MTFVLTTKAIENLGFLMGDKGELGRSVAFFSLFVLTCYRAYVLTKWDLDFPAAERHPFRGKLRVVSWGPRCHAPGVETPGCGRDTPSGL